MRNKLVSCLAVVSLCLSLLASTGVSVAAETSVRVTLPNFKVNLNGHTVDNQFREYPLLVYKDITYFPMTWYDSRLLGLEANWSPEKGLEIAEDQVTSSYMPYQTDHRNASSYNAGVPASAISINGKTIDNTKETYPLLSFRDVTYFPLTWRFAYDEFGWEYEWDASEGLTIHSHNPQLLTADLPADAGENDVALYKGYYYFAETTGTQNQIYRAPAQHPSDKDAIYSYDIDTGYGLQKWVSFQIREDGLWFMYHVGGATMGHDVFVKVGDDGKAEVRYNGYLDFKNTPYGTLIVNMGNPPSGGNLSLVPPGQQGLAGKAVGNSELLYGRHVTVSDSSIGVGGDESSTIIGDDVYVLGTSYSPEHYDDLNKIYRINLKTNETTKIVNAEVHRFRIYDNKLFYVKDVDNALYASNLDGTGERKLSDNSVSWFEEIGGNVYYTTAIANKYELYRVDPNGNDPSVLKALLSSVQLVNGNIVCRLDEKEDYGVVVLDALGNMLLAVTDPITRVLTSDGPILLSSSNQIIKITEEPKINVNQIDKYINLTDNTEVYKTASKSSKLLATITPQSVHAFENMNNWYHIRSSWLGDSWIYVDDKNTAPTSSNEYHAPTFVPLKNIDGKWSFEHQYEHVSFNIVYSLGNNVAPNLTYPRYPGEGVKIGEPVALNLSLINRASDSVETVIHHDFEIQIFSHDGLVWRGKVPEPTNIPLNTLATMGIDFHWNQKDSDGNPVPAGQYSVYLLTPANIEYSIEGKEGTFTEHIDKVADKTLGGYFTIQ